jgi:hypothetical protein
VPQLEQHGSGGEGGYEEEREYVPFTWGMTEEQTRQWCVNYWDTVRVIHEEQ